MKKSLFLVVVFASVVLGCKQKKDSGEGFIPIVDKALYDTTSIYYADFANYPTGRKDLAIGMFDSGTGGLTVLEKFLVCDEYDNATGEAVSDGVPDFAGEYFRYLADDANMPYGNYAAENRSDFLRELVVRDALFLMDSDDPVKILVIACNTATAYGLADIEGMLRESGTGVKVIGVINAGVKASLERLDKGSDSGIGVLATPGTISSGAYERTIKEMAEKIGFEGVVEVVNQPGYGFAEVVDGIKEYVISGQSEYRDDYKGPGVGSGEKDIDINLLDVYNFDRSPDALIVKYDGEEIVGMQLNSQGNYARFNLVSLFEKYRRSGKEIPVRNVILGCTHYPYLLDTLNRVVDELREYVVDGVYPYRDLIDPEMEFIDPALYTAKECYEALRASDELAARASETSLSAYISVPADNLSSDKLDKYGALSYDFKYGRDPGSEDVTTFIVPFSRDNIDGDVFVRLERLVPYSYMLIDRFIVNN